MMGDVLALAFSNSVMWHKWVTVWVKTSIAWTSDFGHYEICEEEHDKFKFTEIIE